MNKWSLKQTKKIDKDLANFIEKRFHNNITFFVNDLDLYHAIIYLNKTDTDAYMSVIRSTNENAFLSIRCGSDKYAVISNKIEAMYNHYNDIAKKLNGRNKLPL